MLWLIWCTICGFETLVISLIGFKKKNLVNFHSKTIIQRRLFFIFTFQNLKIFGMWQTTILKKNRDSERLERKVGLGFVGSNFRFGQFARITSEVHILSSTWPNFANLVSLESQERVEFIQPIKSLFWTY
jgi:hypothetical protein